MIVIIANDVYNYFVNTFASSLREHARNLTLYVI